MDTGGTDRSADPNMVRVVLALQGLRDTLTVLSLVLKDLKLEAELQMPGEVTAQAHAALQRAMGGSESGDSGEIRERPVP